MQWQPSQIHGVDSYHDGHTRWYRCCECSYFNDRSYHCRMHYERIHVNGGREMVGKLKFLDPAVIHQTDSTDPRPPVKKKVAVVAPLLLTTTIGSYLSFRSADWQQHTTQAAAPLALERDAVTLLSINPTTMIDTADFFVDDFQQDSAV